MGISSTPIYSVLMMFSTLLLYGGVAITLIIAWRWPLLGSPLFHRIEAWGRRFGAHKAAAVVAVSVLVLVLRLGLWPVLRLRVPVVHDEFCYLLGADTFVHGRLTNPPHPMSMYLPTFHVIQSPTYMSMFPPGQSAVLAVGQMLGNPWLGVLLSVACLAGAITWALQVWVPSKWAFLGGIIAVAQFGAINYWMESYWGGAAAAVGGALITGALPRILRHQRPRDAILLALGAGILANSRPYEGFVFCIGIFAFFWLLKRHKLPVRVVVLRLVVPFAGVLILVGAFIAYNNLRITGNPFVLPYAFGYHARFSSPLFLWSKLGPSLHYPNPQFEDYYYGARSGWLSQSTWQGFIHVLPHKMAAYLDFYAPPQLGFPILVSLLTLTRSPKIRFCFAVCAFLAAGTLAVQTYFPHYLAPLTAIIYVMIVTGLRYISHWKTKTRPVGIGMVRALVLFHLALLPMHVGALNLIQHRVHVSQFAPQLRAGMQGKLEGLSGQHLVIVRYGPHYNPHSDIWIYNQADIDSSKVVWAREMPDIQPLLNYFRGRTIWLLELDADPPRLSPYSHAVESRAKGVPSPAPSGHE